MKLPLVLAVLSVSLSLSLSSPLHRSRRHGGHAVAPAPVSRTQSSKIKIVSGVDNKSAAEASILDVDVGTNVGVDLGTNVSAANGLLEGGLGGPLIGSGALNLGNILGGLLSGLGSAGKTLKRDKDALDEIIADVESKNQAVSSSGRPSILPIAQPPLAAVSLPASASVGNPLGGDLLGGLTNVLNSVLDPTGARTV